MRFGLRKQRWDVESHSLTVRRHGAPTTLATLIGAGRSSNQQ